MSQQALLLLLVGVPPTPSTCACEYGAPALARRRRAQSGPPICSPTPPERYEDFNGSRRRSSARVATPPSSASSRSRNMTEATFFGSSTGPVILEYRQLAGRYRKLIQSLDRKSAREAPRARRVGPAVEGTSTISRHRFPRRPRRRRGEASGGGDRHAYPTSGIGPPRRGTAPRSHQASPPGAGVTVRGLTSIASPSAWLIKRFIDPDATFIFAVPASFRRTRSRSMHRTWS